MNKLLLVTLATVFTANAAIAQSIAEVNGVITDPSGRTLYTFDKDAEYRSNCNGGCATAWPPYLLKEADRIPVNASFVRRDDNTLQWALNGKPLYYYAADTQRGEMKGDGQGGVWHAVRPEGRRSQAAPVPAVRTVEGNYTYGGIY